MWARKSVLSKATNFWISARVYSHYFFMPELFPFFRGKRPRPKIRNDRLLPNVKDEECLRDWKTDTKHELPSGSEVFPGHGGLGRNNEEKNARVPRFWPEYL